MSGRALEEQLNYQLQQHQLVHNVPFWFLQRKASIERHR
jgi:hypothetical protein